jgi:hypothetical protein
VRAICMPRRFIRNRLAQWKLAGEPSRPNRADCVMWRTPPLVITHHPFPAIADLRDLVILRSAPCALRP